MFSTILSGAIAGISSYLVHVEVDLSSGLPCFVMVGKLGGEVKEAREKSGTWITVDMALEQGKSVYAVPGRLTDRLSDGCNLLIRQGAGIALSPEDLLEELDVLKNRDGKDLSYEQTRERITSDISKCLDFYPKSVDEIAEELKMEGVEKPLPEILTELVELCLSGKARQIAGSYFVKNNK